MTIRSVAVAVLAFLVVAVGPAACAPPGGEGGDATPAPQSADDTTGLVANNPRDRSALEEGGQVTLPLAEWPTNFNAFHVDGNVAAYTDVVAATDPVLFDLAPDGTVSPRTDFLLEMPAVATRNGKETVTYTLNPRARWNDGTPIDHTAFEATWKAHRAPVERSGYKNVATAGYENIESVAPGSAPNEVVVTFARPFHPVTEIFGGLVHPQLGATPQAFDRAMATDFRPDLRSGPFTLESLDATTKTIVLTRNPHWWGARPLLDRVVFRQMEPSATIPAFTNGEIDATNVANRARYAEIQGAPDLDIRRSQRLSTNVLVLNSKADGLTDVAVRKAIWQGTDREEWKRIRFAGLNWTAKPVGSVLYYGFQPQARDNMPVHFSVEDAKKTLEGAGYALGPDGFYAKGGRQLAVTYTSFGDDPLTTGLARLHQNQMKRIGIDLRIDIRPAASYGQAVEKRDYGLLAMAWSSGSPSPVLSACQFYCSTSPANYSSAGDPGLDARMRRLGSIADPAAQAAEVNAVEKEWMATTYGQLPLSTEPAMRAMRRGLANLGPALYASLRPAWEDVGWEKGSRHG